LYCQSLLEYFDKKNLIKHKSKAIPMKLLRESIKDDYLSYPGKISLSPTEKMMAIADTGHHRIIIATTAGVVLHVIGGKDAGLKDGSLSVAKFNAPQGM